MSRSICDDLFHFPFTKLVSWLMLAFVLSRVVPILFQKVSRLLASLYLISSSSDEFSFECDGNELSASYWVSYFHQASIGTHISYHFISNLSGRHKSRCLSDKELLFSQIPGLIFPKPSLPPSDSLYQNQSVEFIVMLENQSIRKISKLSSITLPDHRFKRLGGKKASCYTYKQYLEHCIKVIVAKQDTKFILLGLVSSKRIP